MMPNRGTYSSARNGMSAANFMPGQGADRGSFDSSGMRLGGVVGQRRTRHSHQNR
jgi:hypothetical protein